MYDTPRAIQGGTPRAIQGGPVTTANVQYESKTISGPEAPRSEIASCLADQEKATHVLTEVLDLLESKLMPVTIQAPPAQQNGVNEAPPVNVPVAGCIVENTSRIQRAIARIEDLRHRIAV